ncbi:MAG: D-alanine/glycine transport protein sodium-dependent [Chlamydiales bacterium]|jgi:AGCS family alanine or glycine:cation symporter|nr:D-alanine/glycine transport protein sodium-dependent [Chlamydiales bacterium]
MHTLFENILSFEWILWGYFAVPIMVIVGLYLSFYANWIQIRQFPASVRYFFSCFRPSDDDQGIKRGITPLQAFFASMGGCIGIGNVVGVCTAVQIGGPGAAFWMWFAALLGMILKYSEVYLGIKYREPNTQGGYDGGPMYFLQKAFTSKWIPYVVAFLLCIYGVEIYIFDVVKDSIVSTSGWNPLLVTLILLGLVLLGGSGGIKRVGIISEWMIPIFIIIFAGMVLWVLLQNIMILPRLILMIVKSAFTGHAATGAFVGSTAALAIHKGFIRACYTGDIGVGYASIIQSEAKTSEPHKQASLAIFGIFVDTFLICSFSILIILATNLWKEPLDASLLVQTALSRYFPYMEIFMPIFIFLLGYSTLIAYFSIGVKCSQFLSPKHGKKFFYAYAVAAFIFFSFKEATEAIAIMGIAGGLLLVINVIGILRLRHEIHFDIENKHEEQTTISSS